MLEGTVGPNGKPIAAVGAVQLKILRAAREEVRETSHAGDTFAISYHRRRGEENVECSHGVRVRCKQVAFPEVLGFDDVRKTPSFFFQLSRSRVQETIYHSVPPIKKTTTNYLRLYSFTSRVTVEAV